MADEKVMHSGHFGMSEGVHGAAGYYCAIP